jgi:hypothetical protein
MSSCPGLHCSGCGKGGITAGGVLAIVGAVTVLANRRAIGHAASDVGHVILIIIEVTSTLAVIGLAALVAYAATRTGKLLTNRRAANLAASQTRSEPHAAIVGQVVKLGQTDRPAIAPVAPKSTSVARSAYPVEHAKRS